MSFFPSLCVLGQMPDPYRGLFTNMANKPNRFNNDAVFGNFVAGVQSHSDRNLSLSSDVPEATREEIVDLNVDILQNDLEVGGASPSFPPTIDPAPSHNLSAKQIWLRP